VSANPSRSAEICVVTFNSAATITRLLLSLNHDPPAHVRIVDNASTDNTLSVIRSCLESLRYPIEITESSRNLGFPVASNLLLKRCQSRIVALINPDIELPPETLSQLVRVVLDDRSVGVATCRLITRDGRPQSEPARARPRLSRLVAGHLPRRLTSSLRGAHHSARLYADHDVECMSGALMVFRRDLLDEIGLLDESVFMYLEDIDFAARVRRGGYRIRYVGTVWAWHDSGASARPYESALYSLLPKVWIAYLARYGQLHQRILARPTLVAVCGVAALSRALTGEAPKGELLGLWNALTYRPLKRPVWS
jgi:GT2 family glycosyltransferase